ncbi:MAG: hypothetical protein HY935_07110 [Nitrosomonadales bacterium]|nr:hypothetical protein [Nitrosomonadales bacterium]
MNKLALDAAILVKKRTKGKLHHGLVKPVRLCYGGRSFDFENRYDRRRIHATGA